MTDVLDLPGAGLRESPKGEAAGPRNDPVIVEFRNVSKSYDGKILAVSDLNCAVRKGEFVTFLGPSGSGKTTSLMMLAGFEAPTTGEILLNGRPIVHVPPYRRNMGVVFQNYALFPHMSVADNIAFPLRARRVSIAEIRVRLEHVLRLVRLTSLEKRKPAELSGGQQQRVALARALVFSPDVILMDEPLGALDKQLRERLQIEIKRIQRELELTVIYVTHDQSEALTMSDRIAVFNCGEVQQVASGRDLYDAPANAFVAQFVGETNRLSGVIAATDGARCTVRTDGGQTIVADLIGEGSVGARAILCFRPERIVLGPGQDEENVFQVQVEELVYHGDHSRLTMRFGSDGLLFTRIPNSAGRPKFSSGDAITIGWRAGDCRAFAGASARSSDPLMSESER